jgi:hypothetical protein
MRLTYGELRTMAVSPDQAGAYTRSVFGEGNIGVHVHPGSSEIHVWVENAGRVAVVFPDGTTRAERSTETLPQSVRGLYSLLP